MTYVMSDLHGMYDRFIAMLEKIDFSDSDELFIIGDIIDRGERPVDILEYVMDKPNITVLLGNHEVMARDFLRRLTAEITDENTASFDNDFLVELAIYKHNGGIPTINRLIALPPDKQQRVLDFIDSLYAYEAIDIGVSTFVLVHAGLGNFRKDKKISEYSLYELLELRPHPFTDRFLCLLFISFIQQIGHIGNILLHRHMGKQDAALDGIADISPQKGLVFIPDVLSVNQDVSRRGLQQAVDHLKGRCLAASG